MNMLGPLANPAGVRRQVVGVADAARAELIAAALADLECDWALVVHARIGMDEISPEGLTDVWEVRPGRVKHWTLDPAAHGLANGSAETLAGGTPAENAEMVRGILEGRDDGPRASAVLLNAAAALLVAGLAKDWSEALDRARSAVRSGAAREVMETLVRESASTSE